jgi:hypothetical protein
MHARRVVTRLTVLAVLLMATVSVDDPGTGESITPESVSDESQLGMQEPRRLGDADDAMSRSDCPPPGASSPGATDSHQEYLDTRRRELGVIAEKLSASRDPEHLLAAAILGTDKGSTDRIDALVTALDADPRRPLPLWHLSRACTAHSAVRMCDGQDIERKLLEAGDANGAHWAQIAVYREAQGDLAGALDALANAGSASEYNNHWIESVVMLERSLAASATYTYAERVAEAFSVAASELFPETDVLRACTRHASDSLEWRRICLAFGGMLEQKGGTVMGQARGLGLQIKMLETSGSDASIAAVERRQAQFRRELYDEKLTEGANFLLEHDTNSLSDYLAVFQVYGEKAALDFARREAERLKSLPGYEPCLEQASDATSGD